MPAVQALPRPLRRHPVEVEVEVEVTVEATETVEAMETEIGTAASLA